MPSTKRFAELTFAALAAGTIFAAGQATRLGWLYINTFTHKDFLLYTLLLLPIFFMVLIFRAFFLEHLIHPIKRFFSLLKNPERQEIISEVGVKRWLAITISSLESLVPTAIIIFGILLNDYFMTVMWTGVAVMIILISLRTLVLQQPFIVRKPSSKKMIHVVSNEKVDAKDNAIGITAAIVFIFIAGALTIDTQNLEKIDASILFNDSSKFIDVNILASNSSSIVYWYNGELHISSREQIRTLIRKNAYMGFAQPHSGQARDDH